MAVNLLDHGNVPSSILEARRDTGRFDWSERGLRVFRPGENIAMKVPPHQFAATVRFYEEILGFERTTESDAASAGFRFGDKVLWIDPSPTVSQAELWLEVQTDDLDAAAAHLATHDVTRCDDIERLGEFPGFWISAPSQIIHLVASEGA